MTQPDKGTPNLRLIRERERRNWSQAELARQLGTSHYNVSRWERGVTLPYTRYRQKLCDLFGKSAAELGILPPLSTDTVASQADVSAQGPRIPTNALYDALIPSISDTHGLVGRDTFLADLVKRLCEGEHEPLVALHGLPGVGKTAIAIAVAHTLRIKEHFRDGILWTGLGPDASILNTLKRWATLLQIPLPAGNEATAKKQLIQAIHTAIGTRRMLLIIDDAWNRDVLEFLRAGGPNCAYLLTTRFPEIALQFANHGAIQVHELSEQASIDLITRLAPEVALDEPQAISTLVHVVGGLPLALTLMGKYLHIQSYDGQPRRLQAALTRLHDAEERLRLTQPRLLLDHVQDGITSSTISLQAVIALSDQQLDEQTQYALRSLAVFPAKPNTFSEEAALAVSQLPAEILDRLADAGLLQPGSAGRYTLHQTIVDYARLQQIETEAEQRMVTFFVTYVEQHQPVYAALEEELLNILTALQMASERGLLELLIRGTLAFAPFLIIRGLYSEAMLHLTRSQQAAYMLNDQQSQARIWLHIGRIAEERGELVQAEHIYQQGLQIARTLESEDILIALLVHCGEVAQNRSNYQQAENYLLEALKMAQEGARPESICLILRNLGEVADSRGQHEQGTRFYQEGLLYARQVGDRETTITLLQNLGVKAEWSGDYSRAATYYAEGLEVAREMGHRPRICAMLMNMGVLAVRQQRYTQAEQLYTESLQLAQSLGAVRRISALHQNLGELERLRSNYLQAEHHLRESLKLAQTADDPWLLNETMNEYGELYLNENRLAEAESYFKQVHTAARDMEAQQLLATSLYGLARIAHAQGHDPEAQEYATESFKIFTAMNHSKKHEVAYWLATHIVLDILSPSDS